MLPAGSTPTSRDPRPHRPRVLVVEDEPPLQKFLRAALESNDYDVVLATTGTQALRHASNDRPDLILLDLGLPDFDGLEVTRRLREWTRIPIIVISARGQENDKVAALDAGADDYVTKPFGVPELLARLRVALRHAAATRTPNGEPVLTLGGEGGLTIDLAARRIVRGKEEIHLTPNEFRLLAALAKHPGRVLTHRQLLHEVWGPGSGNESHYLRVYINQLRQKLEPDPNKPTLLLTETGVGYRFADQATDMETS
jgi:two-component system KDP operon response regulator KdpE